MHQDLITTFGKRNIAVVVVENGEETCERILGMIPEKSSVGHGGSETLNQIGIIEKIREGDFELFERSKTAEYFLSGSNAITRDGKIVNKDRTGNRTASLIYGPKHVIIVVGKNKIVEDFDAAIERIKNIAAPLNAKRLNLNTPCALTGKCSDCMSPQRICCTTTIMERQHEPGRMTIILVDEELGY